MLKQGQIPPNIETLCVLKLIYSVAQCSKITNTARFINNKLRDFSAFVQFSTSNVRMSEGTFCRVVVHLALTGQAVSEMFE